MLSFIKNLFGQRQRSGFFRREAPMSNGRRGGIALGTLATIAAPFVIRKLRSRMAERRDAAPVSAA
jgi:hypothetical protein